MLSFVPTSIPPHQKRKERKQLQQQKCLIGIVSWVCLHAAGRPYWRLHACWWSRGKEWSDLDIFEFKSHFCCLGHLLCLLLQLHGHLQPDRRVYGGIRRKYCPCWDTQQYRWRSTSTRSTTRRIRSGALPPSTSSSTVGLDLMATRTTPGLGFYYSPIRWLKSNWWQTGGGEGEG